MTLLSTHVLDTERGMPASGVRVTLLRAQQTLASAETDANGRIAQLGTELGPGTYRLEFDVASYLTAHGREAPFLQQVSLEFRVDGHSPHYHVPLLMTPYACSAYRGS